MGFGEWLKKATTIPTKGPLGGIGRALRPIVGENIMDEIGTVGGFLVGGPAGAAAGRALGNGMHTQNVGKTLRAGAEGYAMGTGAELLGASGGSWSPFGGGGGGGAAANMGKLPSGQLANSVVEPTAGSLKLGMNAMPSGKLAGMAGPQMAGAVPMPGAVPGLPSVGGAGGGGRFGRFGGINLGGIGKFLGGNDGMNGLATAQMLTGVMGGRQQGRVADQQYAADRDDMMFQRQRQTGIDAQRAKLMEQIMATMAARRAG